MANLEPIETGEYASLVYVVTSDPTGSPAGTYNPGSFVLWKKPVGQTDILYLAMASGSLSDTSGF